MAEPAAKRPAESPAEPLKRRLWCVFSDDINNPFLIDCDIGVDTVDDVRRRIWEGDGGLGMGHWNLKLYSSILPKDNQYLHPQKQITSNFPQSNDQNLDVFIIRPRKQQRSATRVISPTSLIPRHIVHSRDTTVSKLAEIVDSNDIVHVRGTPSSGKSVLSLLLKEHFRQQGKTVFWLGAWEKSLEEFGHENPWANFSKMIRLHYSWLPREQNILADDNIVILDEAQMSYRDTAFWNHIVKSIQSRLEYRIKLCLFASYGSPSVGTPYNLINSPTPVRFSARQCISLSPSAEEGSPEIGLFYTESEFEGVMEKLCSTSITEKYQIDQDAKSYIYCLTNGHPGAVNSIVRYIFEVYRSEVKHKVITVITKDCVIQALEDDSKVFLGLSSAPVARSFPDKSRLNIEARNILRKVLEDGYIIFDQSDNGIRCCYENGWIHRVSAREGTDIGILASRLHEKYIEHLIGDKAREFPDKVFPTIESMCAKILNCFSKRNLQHCLEGKLSTAGKPRPLEAQYQDEFYRAFNTVVGQGVPISSEWSRKGDGRVDFWIPQKRWGIELLREHNRIDEHCRRFKKGGRYYPWIECGMLEDWIIIDCATTFPASGYSEPKLWYAVFENNYSELQVLNYKKERLADPTVLVH